MMIKLLSKLALHNHLIIYKWLNDYEEQVLIIILSSLIYHSNLSFLTNDRIARLLENLKKQPLRSI